MINLESPFVWIMGAIGLGYLIAQFLIFVLVIYAVENGKIDLSSLSVSKVRAIKLVNFVFGFCFGFMFLSILIVSASRHLLDGYYDLVPLVFVGSAFLFFLLIAFIIGLFK